MSMQTSIEVHGLGEFDRKAICRAHQLWLAFYVVFLASVSHPGTTGAPSIPFRTDGFTIAELQELAGDVQVSVYKAEGRVVEDARIADLDLEALQPCTLRVAGKVRMVKVVVKEGRARHR